MIYALKNSHYSIVKEITNSYVADYVNKADLIQTVMSLGITKDKHLVHNLCIVMVKLLIEQNVLNLYDDPYNRNMLDLTILGIEKWINTFCESDSFVLNNVCKILEALLKSRLFYEKFKNKACIDTLIRISRDPLTPTATKSLILKITSGYSTILSADIIKYYQLDNPDFKRYGSLSTSLLKKNILDSNNGRFEEPQKGCETPVSSGAPRKSLYNFNNDFSKSTATLRSSLPLINSARNNFGPTDFKSKKLDLPEWARSIPEYMNPDALRPAKQLKGFMHRKTSNLIEDIKQQDENILQKKIQQSRDIYRSPLYKITYFSDGKHPLNDQPPAEKRYV